MTVNKLTDNVQPMNVTDKINEIIDEFDNLNVDVDGSTITKNSSDELQTVAVKDNRSGNAIKTWTGTVSQVPSTTDATTLYFKTDDVTNNGSIVNDLNGKADVDLTNCTVPVVVSRTANNQGGIVEIWSDGYCIQTGKTGLIADYGSYNVSLSQAYIDTNYIITTGGTWNGTNDDGGWIGAYTIQIPTITTSSFAVYSRSGTAKNINWRTEGYIR